MRSLLQKLLYILAAPLRPTPLASLEQLSQSDLRVLSLELEVLTVPAE